MTLYEKLFLKQKRTIKQDLGLIILLKESSFPKTIDEIKEIELFFPRVKVNGSNKYLSKRGREALKRICDIIHQTKIYKDSLDYNDIFQEVIAEIGQWVNNGSTPNDEEFIRSVDSLLLNKIGNYTFFCRVEGIFLENLDSIKIGKYEIRKYDPLLISGIKDPNDLANNTINKEYGNALVIIGTERGSKSVAQEKFYHNAELSLSVLRLYSCALSDSAIRKLNIRLINNCMLAYGPASTFGWGGSEKNLIFTRHLGSGQKLKLDQEQLNYVNTECFFERISSLIGKEKNNELENAILKALFWIGEAQKDRSNASAWVKLWSSMEGFFTLDDKQITKRILQGISSILVYGGYSHEECGDYKQLKKEIADYYDLRGKVIHRAEYAHIDDIVLDRFSFIVAWTVITMASLLNRGYKTLLQIREEAARLDSSEKTSDNQSQVASSTDS